MAINCGPEDQMTYESILYEQHGPVVKITMNRPDVLNALSEQMVNEISAALDQADGDPEVRAVILAGAGRSFCAGYDMKREGSSDEDRPSAMDPESSEMEEYLRYWWERDASHTDDLTHIWKLGVPVIAMVHGYCMGGGFWYSLACDITIASDDAVFGQPEVRHISNTTFLLAALTNWKHAHEWALTGDHMDAQHAEKLGIVNRVVPRDRLEEEVFRLAERIALVPEPSVRVNKAVTWMGLSAMGLTAAMDVNAALSSIAHSSHGEYRKMLNAAHQAGGLRGFLEARDGPFQPEPQGPRSRPRQSSEST